jgi:surface protein
MKKLTYLFLALLMLACTTDDNNNVDNSNTLEKKWLYTHTALEATAASSTTIVMPFTEDIFAFTDRPNREFKYISGDEFASYWNDYDDENSFKLDPPNAVLTWVGTDGVSEVEVVITDANFDGNNVIYTIENTTITANQSFEDVSLFVDGNGSGNNVYLASNGITIKACAGAVNGDTGVLNGVTYTVVNLSTLNTLINGQFDLSKVCTSLITDMSSLFKNDTSFNQDISSWDVSNVTDMQGMFAGATSFNQDLSYWDISNVTSSCGVFGNNSEWILPQPNFTGETRIIWLDDNGITLKGCDFPSGFTYTDSDDVTHTWVDNTLLKTMIAEEKDVSTVITTPVTDMIDLFKFNSTFNQNISTWDVSNVTYMGNMFNGATAFNQPIGDWDVNNVTSMVAMFKNTTSFNQDLSNWDVESVTNCVLFNDNSPLTEANIPNFTNCTP